MPCCYYYLNTLSEINGQCISSSHIEFWQLVTQQECLLTAELQRLERQRYEVGYTSVIVATLTVIRYTYCRLNRKCVLFCIVLVFAGCPQVMEIKCENLAFLWLNFSIFITVVTCNIVTVICSISLPTTITNTFLFLLLAHFFSEIAFHCFCLVTCGRPTVRF